MCLTACKSQEITKTSDTSNHFCDLILQSQRMEKSPQQIAVHELCAINTEASLGVSATDTQAFALGKADGDLVGCVHH